MYKCKCGKEFKTEKSLLGHQGRCQLHIIYINSILTEELLIKEYVINKKSIPDISKKTGISIATIHRRLKKIGISRSHSEAALTENSQTKRKKTNLQKYGSDHNFCKDHPSRIKWEKRLKEEEGIINVFQREEVKEKIKNTILDKYGVESSGMITTSRGKNSYSKLHKQVVKELKKIGLKFSIEKKIEKTNGYYWSFDIFFEPNLLVEINGDYWHGNPKIYKPNDIILKGSSKEVKVSDKWKLDKNKIKEAKKFGYDVLVIWESDWNNNKYEQIQRIQDAIKNRQNRKN